MPVPASRPRRTWDLALTIALMVVALIAGLVLTISGRFIGLLADPCGGSVHCDLGRVSTGQIVGTAGPALAVLAAVVVAVVLLVRRRIAFWVPVAGVVLAFALFTAGAGIAGTGVPHH